jgi:hypothetical protein
MRVVSVAVLGIVCLSLAGCGDMPGLKALKNKVIPPKADTAATATGEPLPLPELAAPPPPVGATSVEALDTTTAAQKEAATSVAPSLDETQIGQTIVSLGNPTEPGFWVRGGPVKAAAAGRVETLGGASVQVDLMPGDGPAQLSLAAYQALGLNLTDLVEVRIFAR